MKRVALALTLLLVAACDLSVSSSSVDIDAGLSLPDGGAVECGQNPCLNDGECKLTNEGFTCTCLPGYEGDLCERNVDDCNPNPCLNDGVCTDGVASYSCECAAGFEGVDCSTNIDECFDGPCLNDGTCTDMVNGYLCACAAGYAGTQCEIDVDDCSPNPCQNDGACVDAVNGFTCSCKDGHSGVTCTDEVGTCREDTCQNGGTCKDGPDGFTCTCPPGFNGANCETDIDDCATMPCENGAVCTDKVNGYSCECPEGTTGVNCENQLDPCDPNPCMNGSACSGAGSEAFVCSCAPGYTGAACEIDIDDCASNPCKNGGVCTDGVNDFTCECPTGFSGRTCNSDPPDCPAVDPCEHGMCKPGVDGYKCECEAGFTGVLCEVNVDDCTPGLCVHGKCVDGANAYTCECDPGYEGRDCATDIDDCADVPCKHGSACIDEVDGFSCECADGWGGDDCSANVDDCAPNPCLNGGGCQDGISEYTCVCPHLWSGDRCETNECNLIGVCTGHGMCDGHGGCACSTGWKGVDCEQDIDECTTANPCLHAGQCANTDGGFTCTCAIGYRGATCDACDTGYRDDDHDDVCCAIGYQGAACDVCQAGYEKINGVCQKTCLSTGLQCGAHGACADNNGAPACSCDSGWFGPACDSLQGTCTMSACSGHGACVATSDNTYTCSCATAYVGRSCETRDECVLAVSMGGTPCSNHGQCIDGNNAYTCQCSGGWLGTECDNPDECYVANPSDPDPCNGHGSCTEGNNTYTCQCQSGWLGAHCDNADNCAPNPCMNSGVCQDQVNDTYTCDCSATDYQGTNCETKIDNCAMTPCQNGGKCTDGVRSYTCDCAKTGFTGATCNNDADECAMNPNICNTGVCANAVAAGGGYTCQCPDGTVDVDGDGKNCSSVAILAAGELNTCAITEAGSLHCWGDNALGELALGSNITVAQRLPTRIGPASGWQAVSVGRGHICGIRSGHLYCWGNNSFQQVTPTGDQYKSSIVEVRSDLTWSAVSAGDTHTCAISTGSLYCWGNTADGQAGAATSGAKVDVPKQIAGVYTAVSAGANHTCTLSDTQQLQCFGRNTSGQLGGTTQPIPAPPTGSWTAVKAGPTHTCATSGTTTYCWGAGMQGALGNGMTNDSSSPVAVSNVTDMSSLGTGQDFSCGVVHDADASTTFQLYCWGTNANGLLLTNDASVSQPQLVTRSASKWSAYAVGKTHMCGVDDGLLYCWGTNVNGELGTGGKNMTAANTPVAVKTALVTHDPTSNCSPDPCQNGGVCTDTANGFTCNCTNTGFGGATCTSETDECTATPGICGQGACSDLLGGQGYTCKCPDGLIDVDGTGKVCTNAATIALGTNDSCVLTTANTLHCWGSNRYGQLGLGDVGTTAYYPNESTQTVHTPLRIKNIPGVNDVKDWNKVTVGEKHVCATRAVGGAEELYCWGDNTSGQVGVPVVLTGNPPAHVIPTPTRLDNTQTWIALAAGIAHTCAINASNQMFCWGYNIRGQLGKGAITPASDKFDINAPVVPPGGETGWISVAAGNVHTCAVTQSNTTYCWGGGTNGQIGGGATGMTITAITKVAAPADPQGYTAIDAGFVHSCGLIGTQAYCWGRGDAGAIGNGTFSTLNNPTPIAVMGGLSFARLTLGSAISCGLVPVMGTNPQTYQSYCWGSNSKGLISTSGGNVNVPTRVGMQTWRAFDVGDTHACAVDDANGLLYCWGDNGSENGAGIGKLGTEPASIIANFPLEVVKAAAATNPAQ